MPLMSRAKGRLFDFGEIIARISIQGNFTDWHQRELSVRPNFCQIERIPLKEFGFGERHNLNVKRPRREFAFFDRVVKVPDTVIRIGRRQFAGFVGW